MTTITIIIIGNKSITLRNYWENAGLFNRTYAE